MNDVTRAQLIHHARVMLAQARHFRQRHHALGWSLGWPTALLSFAAQARRRVASEPVQPDLFAEALVRANVTEQRQEIAARPVQRELGGSMTTPARFGIPRMVLGFIAYMLWCSIYPRRFAYENAIANWLLSWAGLWGYRDSQVAWWKQ